MRARELTTDERGSAPVDFVLVGTLLTVLTLAVLQLGLAVYVRNVIHDAAAEGAHHAALADVDPAEGAAHAAAAIGRAVGDAYAQDVTAAVTNADGYPEVRITVRTSLPVVGLIGIPYALEVTADAPLESLGE